MVDSPVVPLEAKHALLPCTEEMPAREDIGLRGNHIYINNGASSQSGAILWTVMLMLGALLMIHC